jgi:hypothetical protein
LLKTDYSFLVCIATKLQTLKKFSRLFQKTIFQKNAVSIKQQINPSINENWHEEINQLFNNQNQYLKSKVQNCLSLEEFQESTKKYGENN